MIEWTPEKIQHARELWDSDLTATQIGEWLTGLWKEKISRNAIIGVAYRHKFTRRADGCSQNPYEDHKVDVPDFIKAWFSSDHSINNMMVKFGCSEYFIRKKAKRLMLGKKALPTRTEENLALHRQKKIVVHHDEREKKCRCGKCEFLALSPLKHCYQHVQQ